MAFRKRRKRNQQVNNTSGANSGQMMNLSLFIMLLAFFIVLNSLSTYEELKAEKVRRSLNITFKNNDVEESLSSTRPSLAQSLSEGHTFDRIEGLFQSQITSFKSEKSKSAGRMNVTVEYDRFITAMKQKDQIDIFKYPTRRESRDNFFLPTLVSLMKANINDAPTRLEIIFHTDKDPSFLQNETPQIIQDRINALGEISRILEARGMPQKLVTIGLEKGNADIVDLNFTKYAPFSPIISDNEGAQ